MDCGTSLLSLGGVSLVVTSCEPTQVDQIANALLDSGGGDELSIETIVAGLEEAPAGHSPECRPSNLRPRWLPKGHLLRCRMLCDSAADVTQSCSESSTHGGRCPTDRAFCKRSLKKKERKIEVLRGKRTAYWNFGMRTNLANGAL